jgi:hypothetical protein
MLLMTNKPQTTTKAFAPFDNVSDSDVVLRSADDIDFYCLKAFLAFSSAVFKDMFDVPQCAPPVSRANTSTSNEDWTADGKPIMRVSEKSATLYRLLAYSYPLFMATDGPPGLDTLEDALAVHEAAHKYQMERVEDYVLEKITSPPLIEENPVRVYAIAYQRGLTNVVTKAAQFTLGKPILGVPYPELRMTPAIALHKLHEYHTLCREKAVALAKKPEQVLPQDIIRVRRMSLLPGGGGNHGHGLRSMPSSPVSATRPPVLWREYVWNSSGSSDAHKVTCETARMPESTIRSRKWWVDFMTQVIAALEKHPGGASVKDLVSSALQNASHCEYCRSRVFDELPRFTDMLAQHIDKAIAEVGSCSSSMV